MSSRSFDRFAGASAILAGVAGFLYALAFIVLRDTLLSALFLLLVGLLSTPAAVAVLGRVYRTDTPFALWGFVLVLLGALGTAVHGGYDLANALHVPDPSLQPLAALPSQVDPRGLLTFGVAGVGLFTFAWLIRRSEHFPASLPYVGYVAAVLLVVLYLGRLILLNPANPVILIAALLYGFIAGPVWYIWLGLTLWSPTYAVAAPVPR